MRAQASKQALNPAGVSWPRFLGQLGLPMRTTGHTHGGLTIISGSTFTLYFNTVLSIRAWGLFDHKGLIALSRGSTRQYWRYCQYFFFKMHAKINLRISPVCVHSLFCTCTCVLSWSGNSTAWPEFLGIDQVCEQSFTDWMYIPQNILSRPLYIAQRLWFCQMRGKFAVDDTSHTDELAPLSARPCLSCERMCANLLLDT